MKTKKFNSRSTLVDVIRGFTIILMIFFHFCFDLNNFNFLNIDIMRTPFWYALPRLIVFLFLLAVGMSLTLAHREKIHWTSFNKRLLKIVFFAFLISLVTYRLFPENWIYFGTLHAIAVISLMCLPFLNRPKLALSVALLLFIPSLFFDINIPWFSLPHESWDYIAPFPWLGAGLIGIFAVHKGWHNYQLPANNPFVRSLNYLGKHSLLIYLIHQPILFGLTALCRSLIK
jgi:uncharacterized membrane protein